MVSRPDRRNMIIAGLSEKEQNAVIEVFRRHAEIERVTL